MLLRRSILLLAVAVLCSPAYAVQSTKTCALTDEQIIAVINTLRDWRKIHAFYTAHFPPCPDDGVFAEGYSELVVRTLAKNWSNVHELTAATRQDRRFKAFVLRHIDATTNEVDLRVILSSATSHCPKGSAALCAEIRNASSQAISELR